MEPPEKIKRLTYDQLDAIITARRAVPLVGFLSVNGKARSACVLRHPGWMEELLKYSNATIESAVRAKMASAISIAALLSAFESMGLGIIAKLDLTLDEYDLIMSPTISAFPELIVLEQDWTPEPLGETSRFRPFRPYELPPIESRTEATTYKKTRPYRRSEDLEEKVSDASVDMEGLMAALKPKPKAEVKLTPEEALAKMLEAMKPKEQKLEELEDRLFETPLVTEEDAPFTEDVVVPIERTKIVQIIRSEVDSKYHLKDENGEFRNPVEGFATPIEAIIFAAGAGLTIK
jgi:hypothetical protein